MHCYTLPCFLVRPEPCTQNLKAMGLLSSQEGGLPGLDRVSEEEVAGQDSAAQEAQAGRLQASRRGGGAPASSG